MSNEVSNKTLASLLVVAIIVSLAGTLFSLGKLGDLSALTGLSITNDTETSTANITIENTVGIATLTGIDFGSGTTNEAASFTLSTQADNNVTNGGYGFNNCSGSSTDCGGIVVENTGNVDVNVTVKTDKLISAWIGGTSPAMSFGSIGGDVSGANVGCAAADDVTLYTGTLTTSEAVACTNLTPGANNKMTFEMNVTIPADAPPTGTASVLTLTFFANDATL